MSPHPQLVELIADDDGCDVPLLWKAFEENRNLTAISLKILTMVSQADSELFDAWCRYFGFKLSSIEIQSKQPIERTLDPKAFDHLTTFTAAHEFNCPISKSFLSYLSSFSPCLKSLSIRCEPEVLSAIPSFSNLEHLHISLLVPWWLTNAQLVQWSEEKLSKLTPHLIGATVKSFVLYARRVPVAWDQMNLNHLMHLDIDTGLFRQLHRLTQAINLHTLSYSYYGSDFCVGEIDDWEFLMENLCKLSVARLRISEHFRNRKEVIDWVATFAEDWPNTRFKVDDYYNNDIICLPDNADGENVVYKTRSKTAATASPDSLVGIQRSENVQAKVRLDQVSAFAKFKTLNFWD